MLQTSGEIVGDLVAIDIQDQRHRGPQLSRITDFPAAFAGHYEDGDQACRQKDYDAARRLWQPLAEAGHARAQLGIAILYYGGLEWCSKSADQGEPQAHYILVAMYRDGRGSALRTMRRPTIVSVLRRAPQAREHAQIRWSAAYARDQTGEKLSPAQLA